MSEGSTSIVIHRPTDEVWRALTDVTRMGEWSPECTGGRWVGAAGPAMGARFEGDNEAKVAGRTVKRWTTTSEVTACEPGRVFEFVAEGYTTWRYQLDAAGVDTRVTESFHYEPHGMQRFVYETLLRRSKAMTKGMGRTLAGLKASLEDKGS